MSFGSPHMLWLLLILPAVWAAYEAYERRRIKRVALHYSYASMAASLRLAPPPWKRLAMPAAMTLGAAALFVGAAHPQITRTRSVAFGEYVVVMDVSISMAADDVHPSRILAARDAALRFCGGLPDDSRVGLVLFSETPWVSVPLTATRQQFVTAVESLGDDALVGGTRIGDAIELAGKQFTGEGAIVLVSDGEGSEDQVPVDHASAACLDSGVRVYAVGVGAQDGVLEFRGNEYEIRYSAEDMRLAADAGGGEFYEAATSGDFTPIYDSIIAKTSTSVEEVADVAAWFCLAAAGTVLAALSLSALGVV